MKTEFDNTENEALSIARVTSIPRIMTPEIEEKLISWCKIEKYNQGDDYSAWVTKKGKFAVSYSNDYPMQHGSGKTFILTDEEFEYAMNRPLTEF